MVFLCNVYVVATGELGYILLWISMSVPASSKQADKYGDGTTN